MLEVQRLEELGRSRDDIILRASGRAWSEVAQPLTAPVLVAGDVRVPATAVSDGMAADGSGLSWTAEFWVPSTVAEAATAWAVETAPVSPPGDELASVVPDGGRPVLGADPPRVLPRLPRPAAGRTSPPPSAPPRHAAPVVARQVPPGDRLRDQLVHLDRVPDMLGEFSAELQRLERRSVELAWIAARTRAADAARVAVTEDRRVLIELRAALDRAERAREEADRARAEAVRETDRLRQQLAAVPPVPRPSLWDAPPRFPHVSPATTPTRLEQDPPHLDPAAPPVREVPSVPRPEHPAPEGAAAPRPATVPPPAAPAPRVDVPTSAGPRCGHRGGSDPGSSGAGARAAPAR